VLGQASERDRKFLATTWDDMPYGIPGQCHVPVGTVFQLHGAPPHFSCHVHAFLDREFPDHWIGRGDPFPILSFSGVYSFGVFLLGVCKGHCLS